MNSHKLKLLTIITEAALEYVLVKDVEGLGVSGYTITDARGRGSRGVRDAGWEASGNIRLEVVCDANTAEAITAHIKKHYYADYAMISFISEVDVVRPDKFSH
jgi:nitrogen regulatory protein PII